MKKSETIRIINAHVRLATVAAGIKFCDVGHQSDEITCSNTGKKLGYLSFLYSVNNVSLAQYQELCTELLATYGCLVDCGDYDTAVKSGYNYVHVRINFK